MKALCFQGPGDIRYQTTDDPVIQSDRDAIIKVNACAICGSDLHIYHGHGFSEDTDFCVGHEAVGEVVEVGRAVTRLRVGDQVMLPAAVGCGACRSCLAGNVVNCLNNGGACYGLSSALQGCQAEAVRVPAADFNAALIPEGIDNEQALMLTDGLATAWFGARNADIAPGSTVAVVGLGPIGLMAVECAFVQGAAQVFAIDLVPERRAYAAAIGAIALDVGDAIEHIREKTAGQMARSVIEAVGVDSTIQLALRLAARRASVSVIGVSQNAKFVFPMARAFSAGLTFRIGTCSVPEEWPALIPLVQSGRLQPQRFISHRMALSDGARAYELCDKRSDGALKMVLYPD